MQINKSRRVIRSPLQDFRNDLKSVRDVLVYSSINKCFLSVRKNDVLRQFKKSPPKYIMIDTIFLRKRMALVIL